MVAKGKIQRALDKARIKRLDEAFDVRTHAPPASGDVATARQTSWAEVAFLPPELALDRDHCVANRILIGGAGGPSNAAASAAYRMLRTRILQRTQSNDWSIIGLTSPGAGDGKSITGINLALTIARQKSSNLFLIDLDMRNPSVCKYLGITPPVEINDYFSGAANAKDIFFSIGIENLVLAGTRTADDHSSDLLSTKKIEELFEYVRQISAEPLILIDLPPLLTTDDALVMAPKVDAILLVMAEGNTRRDSAAKALELLEEYHLAGIVMNRSRAVVKDHYSS